MDTGLLREFDQIQQTRFWQRYEEELLKARDAASSKLCKDSRIGESVVRGDIWQGNLQVIDQIIDTPSRLIGKDD